MGNANRVGGITEQDAESAHTTMTNKDAIGFECAEYSDLYKSLYDMRPSAKECEWFLSLSDTGKRQELQRLQYATVLPKEDEDAFMAEGEVWSACNLIIDKLETYPALLTDELFSVICKVKALQELAEQAQRDAWAS
jgi:hypothetical protein